MNQPPPPLLASPAATKSVPPLTQTTVAGALYTRRSDVELQILRALERPPGEWVNLAARPVGRERLSDEALVFLVREASTRAEVTVAGRLVEQLSRRTTRKALAWAQGFDSTTTEEILLEVDMVIVNLVFAKVPSRQSEFLEVAFGGAVKKHTLKAVGKRKHYPSASQIVVPAVNEDGEATDPVDTILDDRPGPEEITITLEELRRRPELLREALGAIKDPRHREAVILHWLRGWPITDKDKTKPTLEQRFGKSARQIQNWITAAFNDMRAAIGDKK